jgi:hypothetical protein
VCTADAIPTNDPREKPLARGSSMAVADWIRPYDIGFHDAPVIVVWNKLRSSTTPPPGTLKTSRLTDVITVVPLKGSSPAWFWTNTLRN